MDHQPLAMGRRRLARLRSSVAVMPRVHLRELGVTPRTLQLYRKALNSFLLYLVANGISLPRRAEMIDETAAECLNDMFQNGDSLTNAGYLLSALKRFVPQVSRSLFISRQYYNNWRREVVPTRAVPFTWELLHAMSAASLKTGRGDMALILLLGFICFLRPAELLSLRVADVRSFPSGHVIVRLDATKTSVRKQAAESVHTCDFVFARAVSSLLSGRDGSEPIFRGSASSFRTEFARLLSLFEVQNKGFSPYSLRRGGATAFFNKCGSLDMTMLRGRWQDPKTTRIYLDDARAALVSLCFSAFTLAMIVKVGCPWS